MWRGMHNAVFRIETENSQSTPDPFKLTDAQILDKWDYGILSF